jgi:proton-coupled amino acid transporter
MDLDDLPAEEKAKVLARHLVHKQERNGKAPETNSTTGSILETQSGSDAETRSRRSSHCVTPRPMEREDSDAFPILYDAPGADVT